MKKNFCRTQNNVITCHISLKKDNRRTDPGTLLIKLVSLVLTCDLGEVFLKIDWLNSQDFSFV